MTEKKLTSYVVVADIHGDYKALIEALERINFNREEDTLITLGDNFDRGDLNAAVWRFLNQLPHKILIRGNHEMLLLNVLSEGYLNYVDLQNGTDKTIASLSHMSKSQARFDPEAMLLARKSGIIEWIKEKMVWYYETPHYVFVHSWIPNDIDNTDCEEWSSKTWYNASWANVEEEIKSHRILYPNGLEKTIVFGHWATDLLRIKIDGTQSENDKWTGKIWEDKQTKLIGLDSTSALTHYIEAIRIYD